jgi:flagellar hook assembly protein FlgD
VPPGSVLTPESFVVKTLIDNEVKIANQMNVETWDGKDDNGRYVQQGTYLLEVVATDSMFPDKQVTSTVIFPIDLFRVVDVAKTPILGEATSQAEISYLLSKSMDVDIDIYDSQVVIPSPGQTSVWPPLVCGVPLAPLVQDDCIHWMGDTLGSPPSSLPVPIKSFTGERPGDKNITEFWDGFLYDSLGQQGKSDGMYPYILKARVDVPTARYYDIAANGNPYPVDGKLVANQFNPDSAVPPGSPQHYATDKVTGHITVARGPVYFTALAVKPSQPKLFYSSESVYIPVYEVQFAVTRTASVKVEIVSKSSNVCMAPSGPNTVCRTLTRIPPSTLEMVYDPIVINKLSWDGKDEKGEYVKKDGFEVRFTAMPYPAPSNPPQPTIRSEMVNVNNFQIFDQFIWDVMPQNNGQGKFAYQVSVPMKVAIQIFKPGTKINDPSTG